MGQLQLTSQCCQLQQVKRHISQPRQPSSLLTHHRSAQELRGKELRRKELQGKMEPGKHPRVIRREAGFVSCFYSAHCMYIIENCQTDILFVSVVNEVRGCARQARGS